MDAFSLFLNRNVVFGEGVLNSRLFSQLKDDQVRSVALITGKSILKNSSLKSFIESLENEKILIDSFQISGEPSFETVDQIVSELRKNKPQRVIAIGGGSVMDAGKAVSMMLEESGSLKDYLEGVGTKKPSGNKVPFIAVPTTAGTGSEATKNGVINGTSDDPFKKSFRHDRFVPELAVLDPTLAISCPSGVTAASGMDAVTQLIESFVSTDSNPLTDAVAESGLTLIAESLENAVTDGKDLDARGGMAYAAWCSGLCLGNADLGAVHGIAGALGAHFKIPHGAACGIMLPPVTEAVLRRLVKDAAPGSKGFSYLVKYARCGYLLNGEMESGFDIAEGCKKLMARLQTWSKEFQLGRLSDYGVDVADVQKLAEISKSRLSPVQFSTEEMFDIIKSAI